MKQNLKKMGTKRLLVRIYLHLNVYKLSITMNKIINPFYANKDNFYLFVLYRITAKVYVNFSIITKPN